MRIILALTLGLLFCSQAVWAQLPSCTTAISDATTLIKQAKSASATDAVSRANQLEQIHQALANIDLIAACGTAASITSIDETKRTDVQAGAPAGSSGTTTAVASASKTSFLGLALENGSTTQTTSGTSTTVSINPWKFVDSIAHDEKQNLDPNDEGSKLLRKLALSITLNAGGGSGSKQTTTSTNTSSSPTPTTLITQLKEVSDFTVHFDIHNDRDPMSGGAAKKIRDLTKVPDDYFKSADAIGTYLTDDLSAEEQKLVTFNGDINAEVTQFVDGELTKMAKNQAIISSVGTFRQSASDLIRSNSALYSGLAHSPTFSFEYSFDRQPMVQAIASTASTPTALMNTPDLHTARLIHSWGYYTINASASFFGEKTAAMPDVWRDLQFGAKIDIPFSGIANLVDKGTVTFSGLYVDLHQMPLGINLMVNDVSVTKPGKIGLFQAKYTVPLGNGTGVQLPISITYSNRTDLIKESSVQANIGITFDMSKLLAAKQAPTSQ
jgi:hypothetical protein